MLTYILVCHYNKVIKTMQHQNSNFGDEFVRAKIFKGRNIHLLENIQDKHFRVSFVDDFDTP